jgi:hypothetical protein
MTTTQSLTWTDAVQRVSAIAQAKLPEALRGAIQRATALVLAGGVMFDEDGVHAQVRASDGQTWYAVNGTCPCKAAAVAPDGLCKHRLSTMIYKRAAQMQHEPLTMEAAPAIAPEHMVELHGKRFVTFAGLLALAHSRGLTSLTADWTYNDAALSLAQAVAVFPFGTYTECGDATPDNVTKKVSPHFRRVALTRAKARALRDALNIDMVSLEELAE